MRKILAVLAFSAGALLLFFAAAIFAFYHLIQVGELRRFLVSEFESRSGLKLDVGEAEVELGWVLGVSFRDFSLRDPARNITVVSAPKILIRVALLPLLERKLVFSGVRLYGPYARIVRDEQGRVPWLDAVLGLPFNRVQDAGFSLDLRDLRIDEGELRFSDLFARKDPVETRVAAIGVALHRARRVAPFPPLRPGGGAGSPVEVGIDLRAIVDGAERQGDVAVRGRAVLEEGPVDLRKAELDVYVSSANFPAMLLWDIFHLYDKTEPGPRGDLGYRVHWQGSWERGARVTCELRFAHLEADAPDLFSEPVALGDGRIDALLDWKPQAVRFERFEMRSNRLSFSVQGSMTGLNSGDPRLALRFNTPFLPLTVVRRYIPAKLLRSPVESIAGGLERGEIRLGDGEISGRLSELRRISEPGQEERISFRADLRGAGGNYPGERPLAFDAVGGEIILERGVLQYKNLHGTIGQSRIVELSGTHRQPFSPAGALELRIRADADLAQLQEAASILPPAFGKTIDSLHDVGGRARLNLLVRTDSRSPVYYEGVAAVDGARFRTGSLALSQIKGEMRFSPSEIRAERAAASLNGSDLHFGLLLKNFATGEGTFDFAVDSPGVKASDALGFLLPLDVSKSPGIVRGAVRYRGAFASSDSRSLTGQLELVGAEIQLPVFTEPFRDLSGRIRLDGKTIDLEGMRAKVGGYALNLDGRWRGGGTPMLIFNASSPDMDVQYILPHHAIPDEEWYDRLQIRGKLALDKARYERFSFTDLKTDLVVQKRVWRLERFSARAADGSVEGGGSFNDGEERGLLTIEPTVKGVPLQTLLGWFGVESSEVTGRVQLSGKLEFNGSTPEERRRSLNGALRARIEDGMMRRFQVAVRVLSFLDLSRWFTLKLPNINQEGIRFRRISADVKIARGVYSTSNFFLDGDDLRITGAGDLDGAKGDLDFIIAVRPFPRLDSAANYIPVLGTGLAAIKNSLLVASFHVHGPINDPSVTPAPLSTLSEFFYGALAIPKGLIGFPATAAPQEAVLPQ